MLTLELTQNQPPAPEPLPPTPAETVQQLAQPGMPTIDGLRELQAVSGQLRRDQSGAYQLHGEAVDPAAAKAVEDRASHSWMLSNEATGQLLDDAHVLGGLQTAAEVAADKAASLKRAYQVAREAGYGDPGRLTPDQLSGLVARRVSLSEQIQQAHRAGDQSLPIINPKTFRDLTTLVPAPDRAPAIPPAPQVEPVEYQIPPYTIPQWPTPAPPLVTQSPQTVIPQWREAIPPPPVVASAPNVIQQWKPAGSAAPKEVAVVPAWVEPTVELISPALEPGGDLMDLLVEMSEGSNPSPRLPELLKQRSSAMWSRAVQLKAALSGKTHTAGQWLKTNAPKLMQKVRGEQTPQAKLLARRVVVATAAGAKAIWLAYERAVTAAVEDLDSSLPKPPLV